MHYVMCVEFGKSRPSLTDVRARSCITELNKTQNAFSVWARYAAAVSSSRIGTNGRPRCSPAARFRRPGSDPVQDRGRTAATRVPAHGRPA